MSMSALPLTVTVVGMQGSIIWGQHQRVTTVGCTINTCGPGGNRHNSIVLTALSGGSLW